MKASKNKLKDLLENKKNEWLRIDIESYAAAYDITVKQATAELKKTVAANFFYPSPDFSEKFNGSTDVKRMIFMYQCYVLRNFGGHRCNITFGYKST